MKKFFYFMAAVLVAFAMSSCKTLISPQDLTCNPSPLEVKGGKISADITGTFPEKTFKKKGIIIVTPELRYNGKVLKGTPKTYVGQKVKENGSVIAYKLGGKYAMSVSFPYNAEMKKCELYLTFQATLGKKTVDIPEVKVAEGVLATSTRTNAKKSAVSDNQYKNAVDSITEADIMYLIGQSNVRNTELKSDDVKNLAKALNIIANDSNYSISNLEVAGYASPDGGYELNDKLSQKREETAANYVNKTLKQNKLTAEIDSKTTAEDWDGFQQIMQQSNIQDKDLVLRVLSMYSDPEEREAQIKNLSEVFGTIKTDVLPKLRRSRMTLTTTVKGRTDEEIKRLAKEDPSQLSVNELLYAATLTNSNIEKENILKKAVELYPNDYRCYNNLAAVQIANGEVGQAANNIQKAQALAPNDADVNYNAALVALAQGNTADAEKYLGKSAGTNGDLNDARGTVAVVKGDYAAAKSAFGSTATNNAAIQQIVSKDYAAARTTLESVNPADATTYYLLAVVGARTNDKAALCNNLKKAVAMDANYKAEAANDYEFNAYKDDADFQAIIK